MRNKITVRTRNAANSETKVITTRMVKILAVRTRSLVNFFSFKPSLIVSIFCSVRAIHKTLQWPSIWFLDSLWWLFGKDPIGINLNSWIHNTIYSSVANRFCKLFNEITSMWSINFSSLTRRFTLIFGVLDMHIYLVSHFWRAWARFDQHWHA